MRTIIFDEKVFDWTPNRDYNLAFIKIRVDYLKNLFKTRGYLYLNQIYEKFGVGWNPEDVNDLYLIDDGPIVFEFKPTDENTILIHIKQ